MLVVDLVLGELVDLGLRVVEEKSSAHRLELDEVEKGKNAIP